MNTVLLTGFEPFGDVTSNPSEQIARKLDGVQIAGHTLRGAVLPCVFGQATLHLRRLIRLHQPVLVLCLGVAVGRPAITPERVAINVADARIRDNAGRRPVDRPVVRRGPTAYWSTLPIKAIVKALQAEGIPAEVSQTAGTFVCNHVFYGLMHYLSSGRSSARGGFLHLPAEAVSDGGGQPGLPLGTMERGVRLAIRISLERQRDVQEVGGAL